MSINSIRLCSLALGIVNFPAARLFSKTSDLNAVAGSFPELPFRAFNFPPTRIGLFGPDPVYPILARQGKISGAVVIDAVIDAQGNVVEMRAVSGQPILVLAATEALRHWKYDPTILGGEAIPVQLLVTITFVRPQA